MKPDGCALLDPRWSSLVQKCSVSLPTFAVHPMDSCSSETVTIPFDELPGISRFFKDVAGNEAVYSSLFPQHLPAPQTVTSYLDARLSSYPASDRAVAVRAVEESMEGLALSDSQLQALANLAREDSFAVVTGQQPGLLGGPLYSLVKGVSAVAWHRHLSLMDQHRRPGVVLYWVEDNDDDLMEMGYANVIAADGSSGMVEVSHRKSSPVKTTADTWGVESETAAHLARTIAHHAATGYGDAPDIVTHAYAEGTSFAHAFTKLLHHGLAEQGVLFIRASVMRKRGLFARSFAGDIEHFPQVESGFASSSQHVQAQGYTPQTELGKHSLFFLDSRSRRIPVEYLADGRFQIADAVYTQQALLGMLGANPEMFTTSVFSRARAQDVALPVLAYVGGPGELAYMAQQVDIYKNLGIAMPWYLPRHMALALTPQVHKLLRRYNLHVGSLLRPWHEVRKKVLESAVDVSVYDAIELADKQIEDAVEALSDSISTWEATLRPTALHARASAQKQLLKLRAKIRREQARREGNLLEALRKAHALLYPQSVMQERSLSVASAYLLFGSQFLVGRLLRAFNVIPAGVSLVGSTSEPGAEE